MQQNNENSQEINQSLTKLYPEIAFSSENLLTIGRLLNCVGKDETRPWLQGINLKRISSSEVQICASNGFILKRENIKTIDSLDHLLGDDWESIILRPIGSVSRAMASVKRIAKGKRIIVRSDDGSRKGLIFKSENDLSIFEIVEREYPKVEGLIPNGEDYEEVFSLNFNVLKCLVESLDFKGREKFCRQIIFKVKKGGDVTYGDKAIIVESTVGQGDSIIMPMRKKGY